MKILSLLLGTMCACATLYSQNTFQRTVGGLRNTHILATADSGYITFSSMELVSLGQDEVIIQRIDKNGTPLWTRAYGSTYDETFSGGTQHNGEYYFCGSRIQTADTVGIILKLDSSGNFIWAMSYPFSTQFNCITGLSDGTLGVAGTGHYTASFDANIITMKISQSGTALWGFMPESATTQDTGFAVLEYGSGGLMTVGTWFAGNGNHTGVYYANNAFGAAVFTKTYSNSKLSAAVFSNGRYYLSGMNLNIDDYPLVLETDLNGDTLSTLTVGTIFFHKDVQNIFSVQSGFIITGNSLSISPYALMIDYNGNKIWCKEITDPIAINESSSNSVLSSGGRITIAGYTESGAALPNAWIISGTDFGNFACNTSDAPSGWWQACEPHQTGIIASTLGIASINDTINMPLRGAALTDNMVCILSDASEYENTIVKIFPVPAATTMQIECNKNIDRIEIADMNGKTLKVIPAVHASGARVGISEFVPGIYIVRTITEQGNCIVSKTIIQ